jgi:hypothetical protein
MRVISDLFLAHGANHRGSQEARFLGGGGEGEGYPRSCISNWTGLGNRLEKVTVVREYAAQPQAQPVDRQIMLYQHGGKTSGVAAIYYVSTNPN